jgi:hypothetical protein
VTGAWIIDLELIFLIAFTTIMFIKRTDFLVKSFSLFFLLFLVLVCLSTIIFQMDFSARQVIHDVDLSIIINALAIFYLAFIWSTKNLQSTNLTISRYRPMNGLQHIIVVVALLPVFVFILNYLIKFGFRLDGSFLDTKHERSTIDYYVYVYTIALLTASRNNRIVVVLCIFISLVYFIAAERMKAFLYIISLLLLIGNISNRNKMGIFVLIFGFVSAEIMSLLRSNIDFSDNNSDVNLTHFGEVTVSSMYLLNESPFFSTIEKLNYLFGIFLGNLVPAGMIPESMNIRYFVGNAYNIPGGGWLPVFIFAASGYVGVFLAAIFIGKFYVRLIAVINQKKNYTDIKAFYITFVIIFIATSPNWFMYSPYQVMKMPLYGAVLSYFMIGILNLAPTNFRKAPNFI